MLKIIELIIRLWNYKIVRFFIIGGINTLFGYMVYALCIFIGLHYSLATLISIILGILFNFRTTGIIVFKNHKKSLIFKFALGYGISYGLNVIFLTILHYFNVNSYLSGAILIIPIALLTFYLQKQFVFVEKQTNEIKLDTQSNKDQNLIQ